MERGRTTREQLLDAATRLFTQHGYEGTPIEAVLEESGVSRGALYHHFESKEALFDAVLEATEARIAAEMTAIAGEVADPVEAIRTGALRWFRLSMDPTVRRIALIDAPSVVGWERWREIDDKNALGLLKAALQAAAADGRVPAESVDLFAHVLLAAMMEVAMVIARSPDPERALADGDLAFSRLLDGLFARRPAKRTRR